MNIQIFVGGVETFQWPPTGATLWRRLRIVDLPLVLGKPQQLIFMVLLRVVLICFQRWRLYQLLGLPEFLGAGNFIVASAKLSLGSQIAVTTQTAKG